MNMKQMIQKMYDIEKSKSNINESTELECGDMTAMSSPTPVSQNTGNPVTASVTLNASGIEHVADLMRLLQQAGMSKPEPQTAMSLPMRTDMENLRDKIVGLEGDPSAPKEQYFDVDDVTGGGDDIHSKKAPEDIRVKDSSLADDVRDSEIEEWDNEPEEEYGDHLDLIKRLAGGINREKRQYKAAQPGDNAMAIENDDESEEDKIKESVKSRLYQALDEKKAKPDFLDLDGDGDTKEPMKKAAKDAKKKKTNKSEVSEISSKARKDYHKAAYKSLDKATASGDKKTINKRHRGLDLSYDQGIRDMKKKRKADAARGDYDYTISYGESKVDDSKKKTNEAARYRLVKKAEHGNRAVKIYKDNEWDEFVLKHYENGEYMQDADYFDSDKESVIDTAKYFLSRATQSDNM